MRVLILCLFVILLIGSIYFSLERVLYSDASYILFRIINTGELQIQLNRYGSFVTQGFPLVASKLHLPLSWIVLIYSSSFNLFYLAVAALLVLKLKEYSLAILMGLYFTLFVSDTYYWVIDEIHQAISWMFLFLGLTLYFFRNNSKRYISIPVLSILAFLSIYTHPLVLFPLSFLWVFFSLEHGKKFFSDPTIITLGLIILLIYACKFLVNAGRQDYDHSKLNAVRHISFNKSLHALGSPFAKQLLKNFLFVYWTTPLVIVIGFYLVFKQKKYNALSLVLFFTLIYFIAICITYNEFIRFSIESQVMPLSIILATPFVYYALPVLKQNLGLFVIIIIFLIRIVSIANASSKFVERKNWIYSTLKEMKEKNITKASIDRNDVDIPYYLSDWSTPQESIIASALKKDKPQLTFIVANINDLNKRIPKKNDQMLGTYETWNIQSLNRRYFNFDTTTGYQKLTIIMNSK